MTDPWLVRGSADAKDFVSTELQDKNFGNLIVGFEDDFSPQLDTSTNQIAQSKSLPDSKQYLAILEKKLNKIKRDPNIIEQLSKKREECLRNLLNNTLNLDLDNDLAFDAPVSSGDSAVHEIYRHIQPVQPLNIGETLHIVKYDQLNEQTVLENASPEPASR